VVEEPIQEYDTVKWKYIESELLQRDISDVLLEKELKLALCRLNPAINEQPDRADEVIHKLRAILITVGNVGLVRANEEFSKWLRGEITMPFGKEYKHIPIKIFDFETLKNNSFILTSQIKFRARETKIPDVVFFVNGIPVVIGEAKTPVRPAVSWLDGAHDIHSVYENTIPQLFVPNIFSFATEGKELFIGAVRNDFRTFVFQPSLHQIIAVGVTEHILNGIVQIIIRSYLAV
jgi:type I restriction enzyme, R subunit